jgi:hypothetical protein
VTCALCERKADPADDLYRWNGTGRSHCNDCHADWAQASNACHCVRCHRTFGSPATFERHEGATYCEAPESVGLAPVENRWGSIVYRHTDGAL